MSRAYIFHLNSKWRPKCLNSNSKWPNVFLRTVLTKLCKGKKFQLMLDINHPTISNQCQNGVQLFQFKFKMAGVSIQNLSNFSLLNVCPWDCNGDWIHFQYAICTLYSIQYDFWIWGLFRWRSFLPWICGESDILYWAWCISSVERVKMVDSGVGRSQGVCNYPVRTNRNVY